MLINKFDNVEINLDDGHKYALCDIKSGEFAFLFSLFTNSAGFLETNRDR